MREEQKHILSIVLQVLIFFVCLVFIIKGQRSIGIQGLMLMFGGITGLLLLLWRYNQKNR